MRIKMQVVFMMKGKESISKVNNFLSEHHASKEIRNETMKRKACTPSFGLL